MARKRTIEHVIEEHLATASKEELSSFIRAAGLVLKAKYPDTTAKLVVKRRLAVKSKANGATDTSTVDAGSGTGYLTA